MSELLKITKANVIPRVSVDGEPVVLAVTCSAMEQRADEAEAKSEHLLREGEGFFARAARILEDKNVVLKARLAEFEQVEKLIEECREATAEVPKEGRHRYDYNDNLNCVQANFMTRILEVME